MTFDMPNFTNSASRSVVPSDRDEGSVSALSRELQELREQLEGWDSQLASAQTAHLTDLTDRAIAILVHGEFQDQWDVAKLLPRFGAAAIAPLLELLQDEDAELEVRWFAARILGEFDQPETIAALIQILQKADDDDLQAIAAEALANIGQSAIAALTVLLHQPDAQKLAVQALARIRHSAVIEPLLGVIASSQDTVRAITLEALSSFHDARITPVLLQGLTDPAAAVRREAVIGLGRRSDLLETVDLIEQIQPCLWDVNLDVCRQAVIALGRLGTDAAVKALTRVFRSQHTPASLQVEIARSLGWIGTAQAVEVLAEGLQNRSEAIGQETVVALGQVQLPDLHPQLVSLLTAVIKQEVPAAQWARVRQAAALELGRLGNTESFAPLIQLLRDPDAGVRLHAIAALKQLNPEMAHSRLQQLADQPDLPPDLSQGIAIALQEW